MIRRLAVSAAVVSLCLSGCDRAAKTPEASSAEAQAAPAELAPAPGAPVGADAPVGMQPSPPLDAPAIPGAPAFAALYPGAELDGSPTVADGEAGAGGLVTFHTTASPDEVVSFYRERAESAGLRSVMGMNQGDARAYGAAGEAANGPTLHVVAAPAEGTSTSVQLSWSAGH